MKRFGLLIALIAIVGIYGYFKTSPSQNIQAQVRPFNESAALLQDEQNTVDIIDTFGKGVVAVNVEVSGQRMSPFGLGELDEFFNQIPPEFRRFFDFQQPGNPEDFLQQGSGSGFVIEDGSIITNYHVIQAALEQGSARLREGARVSVVFPNVSESVAVNVVGANALFDLALLQLEDPASLPDDVVPIQFANSEDVKVGQKTIAIGNPFGFASTVTTGIVSGISRSLPGVGEADIPLIQTDAAINPGNSGGPLLNSKGELIGINTAIIPGVGINGQRGNIGLGFAVPSNVLNSNLAQLESGGFSNLQSRPRLGISITDVEIYPASVREQLKLPEDGVVIQSIEEGSAAEKAGLLGGQFTVEVNGQQVSAGGDVILAVDGEDITDVGQLQRIVLGKDAGDSLELDIWRNGEEKTIEVSLAVVPQGDTAESTSPESAPAPLSTGAQLGVSIQDINSYPEEVRSSLNLPSKGVVVVEVLANSAAEDAGLRGSQFTLEVEGETFPAGGDVILAIDGKEINDGQSLVDIIATKSEGDTIELRIWRSGEEQTIDATLLAG